MENQTRFDLSVAIENWRQELAAEPDLTAEVRRELETHLRDVLAEFQRRGLNDEESFFLARRRVGPPQPLGEEFLKANPAAVWRERIMWMAIALLVVSLWSQTASIISSCLFGFTSPSPWRRSQWFFEEQTCRIMFSLLLNSAPMLVAINFLLRGKGQKFSKLALFFRSRSRLLAAAIGWLVLNESYSFHQWVAFSVRSPMFSPSMNLVTTSFWPLALIVLIAWLMGPEKRSAKREPPHHAPN